MVAGLPTLPIVGASAMLGTTATCALELSALVPPTASTRCSPRGASGIEKDVDAPPVPLAVTVLRVSPRSQVSTTVSLAAKPLSVTLTNPPTFEDEVNSVRLGTTVKVCSTRRPLVPPTAMMRCGPAVASGTVNVADPPPAVPVQIEAREGVVALSQ